MFLSFVIPVYNSRPFIGSCLRSIAAQLSPDTEVCLVDNGSTDSTVDFINREYPEARLIRNPQNLGAAFARNQGVRATKGEWIVFLDSDAVIADDFLAVLRERLSSLSPSCAGLTARISQKKTGMIFSCGLKVSSFYRSHDLGKDRPLSSQQVSRGVDGFNSCCAVLRRSCLAVAQDQDQYFDEDFFFLFEDTDLSLRIRKHGYYFLFEPRLTCVHAGGSAPVDLNRRRFYAFRNRLYMILKNEKHPIFFFLRSFFYDLPRTAHFFLTNPYAGEVRGDVVRKFQNAKNTHF